MWDLDNSTDYSAVSGWTRDRDGVHQWLVAVRATFDIMPDGDLVTSPQQPDPPREPQFRGDPATSSLVLDSDLLAVTPATDIVLDAVAYAPKGRPANRVEVSLQVARVSKTLIVHGPRVYVRGVTGKLVTSGSLPFVTHPIHYEWAYGGSDLRNPDARKQRMDRRNPVGKGVTADERDLYEQPAHVVEYAGSHGTNPAGFSPIASFWSPRSERAGTYGSRWEQTRKPLLPDDYDPLFASSAPEDQRVFGPLTGEVVFLSNMTPEGALQFRLPEMAIALRTHFDHRPPVVHQASLATVFITPHEYKVSMIWQGALPVATLEMDYLDYTFIAEEA
ncbi:MAG: DUF2169 domain-containing protein [Gemmatimonadaceae bacterium]